MKKLHIAPVFLGFILCAVLCFPSNASATGSSSPSEQTESASFIRFDLTTIDWTAISSILTLAAVVTSIFSNRTAQKALKATIAIQKQDAGLSMMKQRVPIMTTICGGKPDTVNKNELLYYFNQKCVDLFQDYMSKKRIAALCRSEEEHFFQNLLQQIAENPNANLNTAIEEINRYQYLAQKDPSFVTDDDEQELHELAAKYELRKDHDDCDGNYDPQYLTYSDVEEQSFDASNNEEDALRALLSELESILYSSIQLDVDE